MEFNNADFNFKQLGQKLFNGEVFDTDSKYEVTSIHRFTPGTAGKYILYGNAMIKVQWGGAAGNGQYIVLFQEILKMEVYIGSGGYKNGQTIVQIAFIHIQQLILCYNLIM